MYTCHACECDLGLSGNFSVYLRACFLFCKIHYCCNPHLLGDHSGAAWCTQQVGSMGKTQDGKNTAPGPKFGS